MKIHTIIWRPGLSSRAKHGRDIHNMGDYYTKWLLERMGHETVDYYDLDKSLIGQGPPLHLLRVTGSFSGIKPSSSIVNHFWGNGTSGQFWKWADDSNLRFHAVRGPLTLRSWCPGLDIPQADPGLLVSRFLPLERTSNDGVLWVSHLWSVDQASEDFLAAIGASNQMEILMREEEFESRIHAIRNADMVATSSLHAAVFAASYGVPFFFAWPPGVVPEMYLKYVDFCLSLGIRFQICRTLEEGKRWWEEEGSRLVIPDMDAFLASFPESELAAA